MKREGKRTSFDTSSRLTEWGALLLGIALLTLLIVELPNEVFSPASKSFFFAIGAIGLWRYSWWFIHVLRSLWYNRHVFPKLRAAAEANPAKPDALYVLCTSYRIDPQTSFAVFDALIKETRRYGVPTTIFAAISDRSDVDAIEYALEENAWPGNVEIRYMFQKGDGKRSAMAEVLRAISRSLPPANALLVSMDGDIRLEPGTLERSLIFFHSQQDLGALTTNNQAIVNGGDITREWYDLRYAQRHLMMSSISLSKRLLVLTGRYSAFRVDLAIRADFIDLVENDHVEHWRFGNFKFLSGDDKSTWYWLLKNGWKMQYIPDVFVSGFEELPDPDRFFASTTDLMKRWFGNMLRTSDRAIALGPKPMGLFTWWCLIDQRLSMWTTLIGPTVAILMSLFVRPSFIFAYLLWILFTRTIASLVLAWQRGRFSLTWIFLLYYNQISGALLKTYVSFRFNRQKWSRQGISAGEPQDIKAARRQRRMGHILHGFHAGLLVFLLLLATHILKPLDQVSLAILGDQGMQSLRASATPADFASAARRDSRWLAATMRDVPQDGGVHLPAGRFQINEQLLDSLNEIERLHAAALIGTGIDETAPQHTTLLVSPTVASRIHRGTSQPDSADALSMNCTVDSRCTLTLGQRDISLIDLRIEVISNPS
ncbi:glycosyltransferase [Pistricoccus aurantiacus]|uniref:glycosyltransferase n=1 Tax=Pistricoccus aurantiacus TaxID=1883414 RepID=UPI00363CF12D